jgi:phage gp46-like protein
MSVKIENWQDIKELALMSIGTDKGSWWADPGFGSELWLVKREGGAGRCADGGAAGTLARMLRECLGWLVRDGLCESVDAQAERSGKNTVSYTVTLYKPDGGSEVIAEVWSAV